MGFKILFVGTGNTCRSPMAEAFARKLGMRAESAGTMPGSRVTPAAVQAMQEKGIDIGYHRPKRLEFKQLPDYDRVVVIGDGVVENMPGLAGHENWNLRDIIGQPLGSYREVRDRIEERVHQLVDELNEWQRV